MKEKDHTHTIVSANSANSSWKFANMLVIYESISWYHQLKDNNDNPRYHTHS